MGIEALTGKPIKFRNIVPTITGTEIDEGLRSGRITLVTAPAGYESLLDVARPLPPVGNTTGSNSYITHEVNLDGLGFVARRKTSIVHYGVQQTRTQTKPRSGHDDFMPPPGYVYIASEYRLVMKGYDCHGPHNAVTSWAVPHQFPLAIFGGIRFKIVVLIIVRTLIGRSRTATDILQFCPEHWRRPGYANRLHASGWTPSSTEALIVCLSINILANSA
jgi:hypothetical protein